MAETLNLVNPEDKLSMKYRIDRFPDGQQNVTLLEDGYSTFYQAKNSTVGITIKSRLNDFRDLELIIAATQALKEIGVKKIRLYVPYFIGARSDRKFQEGGVNYLKHVIAPIINAQGYESVQVMDPHSDVLEAVIDRFEKIDMGKFHHFALSRIDNKNNAKDRTVFVSPDAGALKKVYDYASRWNVENVIVANKKRDISTGKIVRTEVPTLDQHKDLNYVIIDDICDGGRTFIELAKAIKLQRPSAKISLIVTHGIFSAGLKPFNGIIDKIYTTNSYRDIDSMNEFGMLNENFLHLVEQINLF